MPPIPLSSRSRPRRPWPALLLLAALCLLAAACGDDGAPSASAPETAPAGFPAAIEHAFGTTTIPAPPRRVIALGPADADTVAALGGDLIATTEIDRGGADGMCPWLERALGDRRPELLAGSAGLPYERIAELEPDLILNDLSTAEDYRRLSQVAPVLPQLTEPGLDPWRERTLAVGRALGREPQARAAIADVEGKLASARERHRDLAGTVFTTSYLNNGGNFNSNGPKSRDVVFLQGLGLRLSPAIARNVAPGAEYAEVGWERLDLLRAPLAIFSYDSEAARRATEARPLFRFDERPGYAVIDPLTGAAPGASSLLSLPYALERYLPALEAARRSGGDGREDARRPGRAFQRREGLWSSRWFRTWTRPRRPGRRCATTSRTSCPTRSSTRCCWSPRS